MTIFKSASKWYEEEGKKQKKSVKWLNETEMKYDIYNKMTTTTKEKCMNIVEKELVIRHSCRRSSFDCRNE